MRSGGGFLFLRMQGGGLSQPKRDICKLKQASRGKRRRLALFPASIATWAFEGGVRVDPNLRAFPCFCAPSRSVIFRGGVFHGAWPEVNYLSCSDSENIREVSRSFNHPRIFSQLAALSSRAFRIDKALRAAFSSWDAIPDTLVFDESSRKKVASKKSLHIAIRCLRLEKPGPIIALISGVSRRFISNRKPGPQRLTWHFFQTGRGRARHGSI